MPSGSTPTLKSTRSDASAKADRERAANPNASPNVLATLADSPDRMTRRAVALNPASPKRVLLKLAPSFPAEFFRNPMFDFMLLEDPNLLAGLPVTVIKHVLKLPDCPKSMLHWAARTGGRSMHLALVDRSDLPKDILLQIAEASQSRPGEIAADRLMRGDFVE